MKNFQVWLFGVLHASPVSRRRYVSELESMTNNLGPPAFVAVEAAPGLFRNVVLDQRSQFRKLASQDSMFNVQERVKSSLGS
jgi:hypothetical protein